MATNDIIELYFSLLCIKIRGYFCILLKFKKYGEFLCGIVIFLIYRKSIV